MSYRLSLQEKNSIAMKFFVAINLYCNEKISLSTIKFGAIDYCNKNFIAIEFCCNKLFLLLLKILYSNEIYCLCKVTNCSPNPKGAGYGPNKPNTINL